MQKFAGACQFTFGGDFVYLPYVMKYLLSWLFIGVACHSVAALPYPQYNDFENEHHKIQTTPIPIIKQNFQQHHEGYHYSYETGNGIHVQETGFLKNKGDKKREYVVQQGTITYHDEHGHPITLTYIADENGFQPQGDHLPTPPPIPEEIQKSLHENSEQQLEFEKQQVPQEEHQQEQQHYESY